MKNVLVAFIALVMVAPAIAFSQEEPELQGPPPGVHAAHNQVVRFLQLSEEQAAAWRDINQIHREAEKPIQEEIADVQAQLEELFDLGMPDPAAVGSLVIDRRELGAILFDIHLVYHEDFVALLDEDQMQRLLLIHRADDVQLLIPIFKMFELIPQR